MKDTRHLMWHFWGLSKGLSLYKQMQNWEAEWEPFCETPEHYYKSHLCLCQLDTEGSSGNMSEWHSVTTPGNIPDY